MENKNIAIQKDTHAKVKAYVKKHRKEFATCGRFVSSVLDEKFRLLEEKEKIETVQTEAREASS